MNPELREHVHLLLQREPTRSLPLPLLRERLRPAAPATLPPASELRHMLMADPAILVLDAQPLHPEGEESLRQFGIVPETRVVLLGSGDAELEPPLENTRSVLLELLERQPGMQGEVAQALGELAELGELLPPAGGGVGLRDGAAAPSTSLPRVPRAPRRSRRARRPPA